MPEHRAGLWFVAVAACVDDHVPGDLGGCGGAVAGGDQVQGEVDAAGDAGRGDDPVVGGEQDVADDGRLRVAQGQFVLDVVVGGAVAAVEESCPAERVGPGADAGHRPAAGVVVPERPQSRVADGGRVDQGEGSPSRHHDQVLGAQLRPVERGRQRQPLGAGDVGLLGDVGERVRVPEVRCGGEDLGRACQVQQVDSGDQEEDDVAHDPVIMPDARRRLPVRRPSRWWRSGLRGRTRCAGRPRRRGGCGGRRGVRRGSGRRGRRGAGWDWWPSRR